MVSSATAGPPTIQITQDGGVRKAIIKEGSGSRPPLYASCLVHYKGFLKSDGREFMDTRAEGEPVRLTAGRESPKQNSGLTQALMTMRVGEVASIAVTPDYGYGPQGHFSFPSVPPNSTLTYHLELLHFDEFPEGKPSYNMLFEERLEAADWHRLAGNDSFKAGDRTEALGKYAMALSYMDQDFMFQLQGIHEEQANAIRLPILLNMAACHLQLADYKGAVEACTQVLSAQNNNAKALYRRGRAFHLSKQTEAALRDLEAARRLQPQDPAIRKEIQAVRKTLAEDRHASDSVFRGLLPKVQPSSRESLVKRLWCSVKSFCLILWTRLTSRAHAH